MKRRPINQLPAVHQTETLKRFFGSTVDHLFQPGSAVPISGYIGRTPSYNDVAKDFYKVEPNEARRKYQLESAMVSETDGALNATLFYDDLISRLSASGALVSDPARLFQSEYWSWAPPIDIDKVNNFQRYYWSGDDVPALELTLPGLEIPAIYRGNTRNDRFDLPRSLPNWRILENDRITVDGQLFDGSPVVLVNGLRTPYTLEGNKVVLASPPARNALVEVYRYGNIGDGVRTNFAYPSLFREGFPADPITDVHVYVNGIETRAFTVVGDHIVLATPAPANMLVTVTLFDSIRALCTGLPYFNIANLNNQGVAEMINGLKVKLIDPYTAFFGFDLKPYATFKWDEMRESLFFVDGVGKAIHLTLVTTGLNLDPQHIVISRDDPAYSHHSRINRWVHADALEWFKGSTVSRQSKRPICEYLAGMALFDYGRTRAPDVDCTLGVTAAYANQPFTSRVTDDSGRVLASGDIVLFGDVGNPSLDNKFFEWPAIDDFTAPGDVVLKLVADAKIGDVFTYLGTGTEYRFQGEWIKCAAPGDYPLYDLFDNNGVSLADEGEYPLSDFRGSRIFCFKIADTGLNDPVLGFPVEYDTYGQILFENDLYTKSYSYRDGEIIGFHYYLTGDSQFDNEWYKSVDLLPAAGSSPKVVVPLNLQANPNFQTPTFISRNNWFEHFASIAANQVDFEGKPYSDNNWQFTQRDLSRGTSIIQSRSPLLKLMLLMAEPNFDFSKAAKFVESEYSRFKLKIRQKINEGIKNGMLLDDSDFHAEAVKILNALVANKTADFSFFLSRIGDDTFFIPPTPAALGILPIVKPHRTTEYKIDFIVGHDGAKTAAVNPITDGILLAVENLIFESRKDEAYKIEARPLVDEYDLISGKWRRGAYSRLEANVLQQASFEEWARVNNTDYQTNNSYDATNPFTWNFGALTDRDGEEIPGSWRGIYRWYFDTETPHTTPWEMLGFAEAPTWWATRYGPAPYTRLHPTMWFDIEAGNIREGIRRGIDARFARPGLLSVLPVDTTGNLLDPVQCRIITTAPTIQFAQENWVFGDGGPIENLWRRSSSFGFAKAHSIFLMRPAQFVEDYWDSDNRALVHDKQWIDIPTNDRASNAELLVHGEEFPDGTQKVSMGIQNWIVEYMINKGQTPAMLGDLVRGLDVRLGHKMAGFTTRDRMQLSAESFGLIPDEDVQISLYQSPGLSSEFYSGVIVEYMGVSKWRVLGYNPVDPYFDVRPSDRAGHKIALSGQDERIVNPWLPNIYYKVGMFVLHDGFVYEAKQNHTSAAVFETAFWDQDDTGLYADERIYKYTDGDNTIVRIPYTTVMTSRQDVVDFLFSYQRDLEARGFGFEAGSWDEAATKFLNWSKVKWANGNFLSLSPGARQITYTTQSGFILDLEGPATSGIVNRTGHLIDNRKTKVDRYDGELTITATGDDIYGVTLRKAEVEHILIFSNTTIFGDLIYDPTLNVRQERLKMSARRTTEWNGRYDAPGFVLTNGQIVANFDKSAEDLRYMFDIELADNTVLRDHARHIIGFENRPYLSNLLLNETQQFELFQGMIQQKGAPGALNKIMRSRAVEGNRDLRFLEEWAFRIGEFGAYEPRGYFEVALGASDLRRENQIVHLGSTIGAANNILSVSANDARWIGKPTDFAELEIRDTSKFYGLPNAGYVRSDETTYSAPSMEDFTVAAKTFLMAGNTYSANEAIWLYSHANAGWDIEYLINAAPDNSENRVEIVDTNATNSDVTGTRLTLTSAHGLKIGDLVLVSGPAGVNYDIAGMFAVGDCGTDWIEIDTEETEQGMAYNFDLAGEVGPLVFKLISGRFPDRATAAMNTLPASALVYVDDAGVGEWAVYRADNLTTPVRQQPAQMDATRVASSLIYDLATDITKDAIKPQPITLARITPIDPMIGVVVGAADKEIDYKLEYDPASYDESATLWTASYVGALWWDMSTTWFLNPYTDILDESNPERYLAEVNYRATNWSRLAAGTSVDIYEWTRSTVSPLNFEGELHPSGEYVSIDEFSSELAKDVPVYYFWVKNPTAIPVNDLGRTLDAKTCSDVLSNPSAAGVPWMAVIAPNEMIISGVRDYLTDDTTVLQLLLQLTDEDEVVPHQQWLMIRPEDAKSQPTQTLWRKMRDSLVGFDDNLAAVPSPSLHASARTGIENKQGMFDASKKTLARQSFTTMVNYQLSRRNLGATQSFGPDVLSYATPVPETLVWTRFDSSRTLSILPPAVFYDAITTDPAEFDDLINDPAFATRRVLLDNRFSDKPGWSVWEKRNGVVSLAPTFHHEVDDLAELAQLTGVSDNDFVLVRENAEYDGFWTIMRHSAGGYSVVHAQTYRTSDFWEYVDWFAEGFTPNDPPIVTYDNVGDRNRAENPEPTNRLVKLLDNGAGYWTWTAYVNDRWITVAQQLGTIQLSDKFFTNTTVYGWDAVNESYRLNGGDVYKRDGSYELRVLFDALLDNAVLTDLEENELWFSMVNFVHAHHDQVDWAFKTSFLSVVGYNEALIDAPVIKPDNTPYILSYIEEVKPYHVTVREFARSLTPRIEMANVRMTDFDKPGYYDEATGEYRTLKETSVSDIEIMKNGVWNDWYENMGLARRVTIQMKIDRVWFENTNDSGAAARITTFYQPTEGMTPGSDLKTLLDLDFKGTVLDGMDFNDVPTHTITGAASSDVTINGQSGNQRGYQMRDPRMATNTPEELVRLGAHDVFLLRAQDKWGAGAPRSVIKTYDVSNETDDKIDLPIDTIARDVLVFVNGVRVNEGDGYTVSHLDNRITNVALADVTSGPPTNDDGDAELGDTWAYDNVWKYRNITQDIEDNSAVGFNDSSWAEGPGGFGSNYDGGNYEVGTYIASTNEGQTIWLRKSFFTVNPASIGDLAVRFWKDDFATLYWNGEIIPQQNVSTYAATAVITVDRILPGKNSLALKVVNGSPRNIFAALELTAPNAVVNGGSGSGEIPTVPEAPIPTFGNRAQAITTHAFGYAGHTTIIDQTFFYPETTDDFEIAVPQSVLDDGSLYYVEVTNNGRFIASTNAQPSVGGPLVKFSAARHEHIVLTFYRGTVPSSTRLVQTKLFNSLAELPPVVITPQLRSASVTAARSMSWMLSDLPLTKPYNSSMVVEVNGLRLTPPHMFHAVKQTEVYLSDIFTPTDIRVTDDQGVESAVVAERDEAFTDVDQIRLVNRQERFILWKNFLVFRDADAGLRDYTVMIAGTGEFNITPQGELTIYNLNAGDDVRTLHWRNDAIMQPRTWVFNAKPKGNYKMITRGRQGSTWLTINGFRLVEDVDYFVSPTVAGAWDLEAFDTFRYDDSTEVEIAIKNTLKLHENDRLVVMTFEGPQNTAKMEWQHSSTTPDIVRFKKVNEDETGRGYEKEPLAWMTESADLRREGGLLARALPLDENSLVLTTNARSVPPIMLAADPVTIPDAYANQPGVVWVGPERIEYFKRSINDNVVDLSQVRRGTKGTPKMVHPLGTPVKVQHPLRRIPKVPLADIVPVPAPSPFDTPYVPPRPPVFEGWYLKVHIKMLYKGRDDSGACLHYFPEQQPNAPFGTSVNIFTGGVQNELGSSNGADCAAKGLCGQKLIERTGDAYDILDTYYYDQAPGHHHLLMQYGAGNWGDVGRPDGTPIEISYWYWDQPTPVVVFNGDISGLYPYDFDFDVLPKR